MRLCTLILLGAAAAAYPQARVDREAAYDQLRDEARAARLVDAVSEDLKQQRYEAALRKADEAVRLRPADAAALNARGAALTELRRFDEAEKALTAAAAADPKSFPPRYNLGEALSLQKKYGAAIEQFRGLQATFGDAAILRYKVYLCLALDGRKDEARAALKDLAYPMDGPAWYYAQAVDRLLAGRPADARRLMAVAAAIHPAEVRNYRETLRDAGLLK